jgi:hypothetical protein
MKQIFVKSSYVQWNCQHLEVEGRGVRPDEPLWDHGDQIRLRYDMQSLGVVRNAEHHLSLAALPKPCIHRIFGELASNDRNMPGFQKHLGLSNLACDRMAASRCARVAICKQALLMKTLERLPSLP